MISFPKPPHGKIGWPWDVALEPISNFMNDVSFWPKVTVVTPSFNQGDYLEETIRSVLLQGYPNLEYMVIDGGSTDQSVSIIRRYEPWLTYWTSKKDKGQAAAINEGFRQAGGNYIAWLNSDDVFLPGAIKYAVEAFRDTPNAGMVYGDVDVIDEKSTKIGSFEPVKYNFEDLLTMKIILPQQAAFFNKTALDTLGLLDENLIYAMDVELFIRIGSRFKITPIHQTTALFRITSHSKGVTAKMNWCSEFITIIEGFYCKSDLSLNYSKFKKKAMAGAYYRGAHTYLEANQYSSARKWLIIATKFYPKYRYKPGWWKCLLLTFLGRFGKQVKHSLFTWLRITGIFVDNANWQIGMAAKDIMNRKDKSQNG